MTLIDKGEAARVCRMLAEKLPLAQHEGALACERAIDAIPARGLPSVDELSNIIRKVDGQNSLGAGALAEAILAALEGAADE